MGVIDCTAFLQEEIRRRKTVIQFLWQRNEVKVDEKVFLNTYFFRGNDNRLIGTDKCNFIKLDFTGVWF